VQYISPETLRSREVERVSKEFDASPDIVAMRKLWRTE
jgi:hypothetical protein